LRLSVHFRACREEQWDCEISSFLQPLSNFTETARGFKNQRYFFSIAVLFLTLWLVQRWLQYYGNLNGDAFNVICTKFVAPLGGIACALYWAVQALPQKDLDLLPPWQQTVMAQVVYVCVIILLLANLVQPAYIFILKHESDRVSVPFGTEDPEQTVPYVLRQLQQHWNKKEDEPQPPAVYGLGSVYSSSLICCGLPVFLLLTLLLGDGVAPSLALAVGILFLCFELMSAYYWASAAKPDTGIKKIIIITMLCEIDLGWRLGF
jgi:phosphatidylinositol glycan class O